MAKFLFSTKALVVLTVLCAALVVADLFGLRYDKVEAAEVPGFYAAVSFVTIFAAAFLARIIRPLIGRDEGFYGDEVQIIESEEEQQDA